MNILRRLSALLLVAILAAFAKSPQGWAAAPTTSPQWVDITAHGADPTGSSDSTSAINASIALAIAGGQPLYLPAGQYQVSQQITIDYSGLAGTGFEIVSDGAIIDGNSIGGIGPVLAIRCGSAFTCLRFHQRGTLTVQGTSANDIVVIGRTDLSDIHISMKLDHFIVINNSSGIAATGCQLNNIRAGDLNLYCASSGGGSGVEVDQVQDSLISGFGVANGTSGAALLIENGNSRGNTIAGFSYGPASNTCLSITSTTAINNTVLAPYFGCTTSINAPQAALGNTIIGPTFAGTNQGPLSTGIALIGRGSLNKQLAPAVASYTAAGIDDGRLISSANATGPASGWAAASLPVTLPTPSQVGVGWTMGFVTEGFNAVVLTPPGGVQILGGGVGVTSMTVGPGNHQIVVLWSDGGNFRLLYASDATLLYNGMEKGYPAAWTRPGGPGYQLTQGDNASVISSAATTSSLALSLPATNSINVGWMVGVVPDNGKPITLSGGSIVPTTGGVVTSQTFSTYAMSIIEFDGAQFRIMSASSQLIDIAHGGTNTTAQTTGGIAFFDGSKITTGGAMTYNSGITMLPHTQFSDIIEQLSSTSDIIFGTGAMPTGLGGADGGGNIAIGPSALVGCNSSACNGSVALGQNAGQNWNGHAGTFIGWSAGQYATTGGSNTFIGGFTGRGGYPTTGALSPAMTGFDNTCIGEAACIVIHGVANFNTAVGFNALFDTEQALNNTAIGHEAGFAIVSNVSDTLVGDGVYKFGKGDQNTIIGATAAQGDNFSTTDANPLGDQAGQNVVTLANTAIFHVGDFFSSGGTPGNAIVQAVGPTTVTLSVNLFSPIQFGTFVFDVPAPHAGTANLIAGYAAALEISGVSSDNTLLGARAAINFNTGNNNVIIGEAAAPTLMSGSNNIVIGIPGVDVPASTTSGNLVIGGAHPAISATNVDTSPVVSIWNGATCNVTTLHHLIITNGVPTTCN